MDMEELPFSVKPEKKISVRDVLALYRQTYEGTEFDRQKISWSRTGGRVQPGKSPSPIRLCHGRCLRSWAPEARRRRSEPDDRHLRLLVRDRASVPRLAADPWADMLVRLRQPCGERPDPDLRGVTELPSSFESAPSTASGRLGGLGLPAANRLPRSAGARPRTLSRRRSPISRRGPSWSCPMSKRSPPTSTEGRQSRGSQKGPRIFDQVHQRFRRAAMDTYQELGDKFWTMFARGF